MMKIAIASGKGGTGKTFVSTHLFHSMESSGLRVALVDCDAEVPNASVFVKDEQRQTWDVQLFCPQIQQDACIFCGECAVHCRFHAITCIPAAHYIRVLPDLCHGCKACLHHCTSGAIQSSVKTIGRVTSYGQHHIRLIEARINEGEHSPVPVIREAIRRGEASGADYLILDAPPGCACPFVNTVMDADRVILVTEPTPFGLSDLKHTIQVLRELKKPFQVIINRADMGDNHLKAYLEEEGITLLAEIPYQPDIARAYAQGELAMERHTELRPLFQHIMNQLINVCE